MDISIGYITNSDCSQEKVSEFWGRLPHGARQEDRGRPGQGGHRSPRGPSPSLLVEQNASSLGRQQILLAFGRCYKPTAAKAKKRKVKQNPLLLPREQRRGRAQNLSQERVGSNQEGHSWIPRSRYTLKNPDVIGARVQNKNAQPYHNKSPSNVPC